MVRVEIAEVPPAVEENGPAAYPRRKLVPRVVAIVARVSRRPRAQGPEQGQLAQPDRAVAHVRVVREIHERVWLVGVEQRAQDAERPAPERGGQIGPARLTRAGAEV